MPYVIGIDAGGTKTMGLLADESGKVVSKMRAGGANLIVKGELAVSGGTPVRGLHRGDSVQ